MRSRGSTKDPTARDIYPALCIQPGFSIWDNQVGLCVNLELVVGVCRFLELRNMSTIPAGYGTGTGKKCFHEHCLSESAQQHLPGLTLSLWPPAQLKMGSVLARDYSPGNPRQQHPSSSLWLRWVPRTRKGFAWLHTCTGFSITNLLLGTWDLARLLCLSPKFPSTGESSFPSSSLNPEALPGKWLQFPFIIGEATN